MGFRLERYLGDLPAMGVSGADVPLYRAYLEPFELFLEERKLVSIGPQELDEFVSLQQQRGYGAQQAEALQGICQSYIAWCAQKEEAATARPNVGMEKVALSPGSGATMYSPDKGDVSSGLDLATIAPMQAMYRARSAEARRSPSAPPGGALPSAQPRTTGSPSTAPAARAPRPARASTGSRPAEHSGFAVLIAFVFILGLGGTAVVVGDGILAEKKTAEFTHYVRFALIQSAGVDEAALEQKIEQAATARDVTVSPGSIRTSTNVLSEEQIHLLTPKDQAALTKARKTPGSNVFVFAEVSLRGQTKGVFRMHTFDLVQRTVTGTGMIHTN